MLSRVPDHPALVLLPQETQGSLTPLAQASVSRVDCDQTLASTSNEATQHDSEVEEICDHRQDNQARNQILKSVLKSA